LFAESEEKPDYTTDLLSHILRMNFSCLKNLRKSRITQPIC